MRLLLKVLIEICQLILFFIGFYYFGVALFSLKISNKERKVNTKHSFALLVAAHNEENVVAELVESLNNMIHTHKGLAGNSAHDMRKALVNIE